MMVNLYNPPPLSLSCPSGSAQAPRVPTPDSSFLVGCANETEPIVLAYCRLPRNTLHPFFADLRILRPRVKGRSFRAVVQCNPSPLLPPPAGWVRCKAHHHPSLRVHQVASGGTATQDYARYPSHLVLHPQRTTSQGAVRCEQCLSITSSA